MGMRMDPEWRGTWEYAPGTGVTIAAFGRRSMRDLGKSRSEKKRGSRVWELSFFSLFPFRFFEYGGGGGAGNTKEENASNKESLKDI